ncbi:MAG: DUF4143 domain-containing protein [Spirochaetia bacterium]|nr:DUF4143 domain-containing protein [Spirochaetia bacterium]
MPPALTSLKYFCEDLPDIDICAAGSLLGLQLSGNSFPVGKVELLHLYPLSFEEYLWALNTPLLEEAYYSAIKNKQISKTAHSKLLEKLYSYFITGGLPAVITEFITLNQILDQSTFIKIRKMQNDLITMYESDFAKHSGKSNSMHIVSVFENIPLQLSKVKNLSTSRYKFSNVIPGKKGYASLQGPIHWLNKASLIHKIGIANRSEIPLKSFTSDNIFKCFLFDIGILGAMLQLPPSELILQNYGITKGYFVENYVLQELTAAGVSVVSWKERNSEIEFLKQDSNGKIFPIEVKAGNRTQAKSLSQYILKYKPDTSVIVSAKPLNIAPGNVIQNIPLYLIGKIEEILDKYKPGS